MNKKPVRKPATVITSGVTQRSLVFSATVSPRAGRAP
jgi:hypothetical protein